MRVYELAKQLGMENRELIPELKRLGIPVASHSSALDEDSVRLALEKLGSKARAGEASSSGHEAKKMGRSPKEPAGSHAVAHEEAPKPDKKRILIKKKREEGAEDAVASLAAAEAVFAPVAPAAPDAGVVDQASPGSEVSEAGPIGPPSAEEPEPQPPVVAASEDLTIKPSQAPAVTTSPTDPLAAAKKKSLVPDVLESEAAAREKLKKAKKAPGPGKKTKPSLRMTPLVGEICGRSRCSGVKTGLNIFTMPRQRKSPSRERKA
ncbi:MAG: translation initiation factor IF-2 N-terminal domain-containing protein [Nitrospira sp.]